MPPKGSTSAGKAKAEISKDTKQPKLVFGLSFARPGKLPATLPPPAEKAPKLQKVTSTRTPVPTEDESITLQVNALVHELIDKVILQEEQDVLKAQIEVRSWLNASIDWVVLKALREQAAVKTEKTFANALKSRRQR